jgi:serine/threonine-protein kinase
MDAPSPDDVTRPDPDAAVRAEEVLATTRDDVDPLIGAFLGAYRIDDVLGRGGMGVVYRAFDVRLERPVALKVMRFASTDARARFQREARAQAGLRHRNVVPVHVVGEHAGLSFIVMDLVEGETLKQTLGREGHLSEARALEIGDAIASALEAARTRGLVHRDVKPSNVLVEPDGHVLLTDFGLAKQLIDDDPTTPDEAPVSAAPRSLTRTGAVLGTPAYLAPEQKRGEKVDHRADMYALGVTLHELIAGERPSPGAALALEGSSPGMRALLRVLLAIRPEDRFATYADLRAAIVRARGVRTVPAPLASRAAALAIDFFAFGAAVGVLNVIAKLVAERVFSTHALAPILTTLAWPFAAVLVGVAEAIYGTTIGKKLLRLRTVDARDSGKPGVTRCIVRSIVKMSPLFAVSLGSVITFPKAWAGFWLIGTGLVLGLPALGSTRTTLHDRIGRTRVILAVEDVA